MEYVPSQTGRMITICKVCCCFVALAICVLSYLMRIPDQVCAIFYLLYRVTSQDGD